MSKGALDEGSIKDHEFDVAPLWVRSVVPSHDANDALKFVSIGPQLSIKGHFRQLGLPFGWCVEWIPVPSEHRLSVPVAANAVKLFAHEPPCWIVLLRVVIVRQHHIDATTRVWLESGCLIDQLVDSLLVIAHFILACYPR